MHRTLIVLAIAAAAFAEEDEALRDEVEDYLDTIVVTATRSPAQAFDTPYATEAVSSKQLRRRAYRTVPQALRDLPGVLVQETSHGQGSPYIRGFTAFHNLFLVDGIRLNNSIFRPGPNQYWNTVDPLSIERLEIVKGPSSVLYGSDAIGGTVNAITIGPYDFGESLTLGGRSYYRIASAENSHTGRAEVSLGLNGKLGAVGGVGGKQFGDLVAGDPTGRQTNTGYEEWNGDLKLEYLLDELTRVVLAYQHVRQNNVPRTHKTVFAVPFAGTSVGSELKRDLDQERYLVYAQLHREKMKGFVEALRTSLSWQVQSELRDRLRTGNRTDLQGVSVGTLGLWLQLESPTGLGRFTYGFEFYHDNVNSFSSRNPIQGPVADEAAYDLLGLFVQDIVELGPRVELTLGARLNYARADADSVQDPATGAQIGLTEDWTAVVGSLRFVFHLVPERWNLFFGVSQGFRAPNLSDLTRLDSARTNEFEVPAPGLDPEFYTAFELGLKGRTDNAAVQVALFYTDIREQIVRFPTGATNIDGENLVTKDNVGDGWVYGLELGGSWRFGRGLTLFGNLTFIEGKVDTFPTSAPVVVREWIDRLMPLTGQLGLRWEDKQRNLWVELLGTAAAKADKLSTRDQSDSSRIPPGGTPGYGVVHLRAGWRFRERLTLQVAIENLLDKSYRVHGSGQNMAGRNLVVSLSLDF